MANAPLQKFLEMLKIVKAKSDELSTDILGAYSENIGAVIKNYTELQDTYSKGYAGITGSAHKGLCSTTNRSLHKLIQDCLPLNKNYILNCIAANGVLLESLDKNYSVLKQNISTLQVETKKKAGEAIDESLKDFQSQIEEILKKFPALPQTAHKEVVQAISDNKGKVTEEIDKRYADFISQLDNNFATTRQELKMPETKLPNLPAFELSSGVLIDTAKNAANYLTTNLPALQNLAENLPGFSKKKWGKFHEPGHRL